MAVNDVYQITVIGSLDGEITNTVLHYGEETAEEDPFPAQAIARGWAATIMPEYLLGCCDAFAIGGIYARRVLPTPSIPYLHIPTTGNVGAEVGNAASSTAAGVITWYTDEVGKSKRGRTYMPAVPESHQDNGLITGLQRTSYLAFVAAHTSLFTGIVDQASSTGQFRGVVFSRKLQSARGIITATVHTNLGTIRGRRRDRLMALVSP